MTQTSKLSARGPKNTNGNLTVTLVAFAVLASGCATSQPTPQGAAYRESYADVTDRAPRSLALPKNSDNERTQADYHFALAESYALEGNNPRAIEEYKLTLVYDPASAQPRLRLAAEHVKQGLISEAMEQAKAAIAIDQGNIDAHLLLGGLFSALRMYDDALKEYRLVLTLDKENTEAPLFIGALLAEQKKYAEAGAEFEKLAKNPANTNAHIAWYYLGRVRLEENKAKGGTKPAKGKDDAESAIRSALRAKPGYSEAALALGQLLENTGRREAARAHYEAFQEKHGPNTTIAEELSRLFIEDKNYAKAYAQFGILEQADENDLNVKAKMAFILIEQARYPEAIVRLEEILEKEPASDKIRFYLGAVFEETKDFRGAIAQFAKIPSASNYYGEAIVHASYLYKLTGDLNKAVATVEDGIRHKDDHPPFYALYASLLDDQKEYKKAAVMLTEAVKKFPDHAQLRFFLGSMQERLGQKEASIESMLNVIRIDKDHVQALNFLAYTYADLDRNLEDAEKYVKQALVLQPGDGFILDTLGWVQFKRGHFTEAIRTLEAAIQVQPNESVIAEHLGDAYYHQQMPEKAKRLYMRAVETDSNVANIEKLKNKISAVDHQAQSDSNSDRKNSARQPASFR